jgi:hypothetical protein
MQSNNISTDDDEFTLLDDGNIEDIPERGCCGIEEEEI